MIEMEAPIVTNSLAEIGDIHAGKGDKRDGWDYGNCQIKCREAPFIQKVMNLMAQFERVGQVGDAWDLWESYFWQIAKHLRKLTRLVIDLLDGVTGNHDDKMRSKGIPAIRQYLIGGKHLGGVMHGHQFDPCNSGPGTVLGKAVSAIWGIFERILPKKMSRAIEHKFDSRDTTTPAQKNYKGKISDYIQKVAEFAFENGWSWVIIGHRHRQGKYRVKIGKKTILVMDAGHCLFPFFQYAWVRMGAKGTLLSGLKKLKV